jgi:hypothetical protein
MSIGQNPCSQRRQSILPALLRFPVPVLLLMSLAGAMIFLQSALAQSHSGAAVDIQPSRVNTPALVPPQLNTHFTGHWTGLLESRPRIATSPDAPDVRLPVRLAMRPSPDGRAVNFSFTYRDSTGKVTHERMILSFTDQTALLTGTVSAQNLVFKVRGLDTFKPLGYGTLILTGPGTANARPVEMQQTLMLQPGEFTWLKQTRSSGSTGAFIFQSKYLFTRDAEAVSSPLP